MTGEVDGGEPIDGRTTDSRTTDGVRARPTASAAGDSPVRGVMLALGCRPGWVAVGTIAAAAALAAVLGVAPAVPAWVRYAPLAVSVLVLGLPHGAVDHLAPARTVGRPPTPRWLLAVGGTYLALGVAYAALWALAPVASAALFIALTWLHWGQGDLYALDAVGSRHLDGAGVRLGTVLVRGGLPMLVPLLRFPERYRQVVDAWVGLFGGEAGVAWLLSTQVRSGLAAAFATVTVVTLLAGWRRASAGDDSDAGGRAGWRRDAAETLLLWAYFLLVPPLFAVGVYFCAWHSLRHVARLVEVDPRARRRAADGEYLGALARVGRDALPLTLVSLAMLAGVAVVVGVATAPATLAALYLVFIAVLTLPHVAVVAWMDRAQGAGLAGPPT
ncbi:Brp/Blh family beta-carotene 15,15'-dioxygenase [Halobaculum sp. CBA1158]|uniref:Brp/Blh family beta-carotene 15,15'-dioxygenase n=1 Tax=Halobaculum sp. CBA1158 TaxID=2904243 RepID=UPI001F27F20F|nr:Brp/Blh family beta-carotene 15,15'-dioxygenase [Halobaculum sp. CBA1158]UIO99199.1 Brp/Blh family beta-carotene 15,15'-dioxygenase [Halobaculum sp. CBA1158]